METWASINTIKVSDPSSSFTLRVMLVRILAKEEICILLSLYFKLPLLDNEAYAKYIMPERYYDEVGITHHNINPIEGCKVFGLRIKLKKQQHSWCFQIELLLIGKDKGLWRKD